MRFGRTIGYIRNNILRRALLIGTRFLTFALVTIIPSAAALAATHINAYVTAEVRNIGNTTNTAIVPVETDYIPNVVQAENGAASNEALKAQAVAARSYLYYKLNRFGHISDGSEDQVYTNGGGSIPGGTAPGPRHIAAAAETEWEILRYHNTQVAAFYVAGMRPSTSGSAPYGVAEEDDGGHQGTEKHVTYNRGKIGSNVTQTPLGLVAPTNWANRGAKSQNGADFLSDNGWNYVDILRFYYGADIRLEVAASPLTGETPAIKTIAGFEIDQGYFGNGYISPANTNITAVTRTRSTSHVHGGSGSQRIDIDFNSAPGGFSFLNVAGLGPNSTTLIDGVTPGQGLVGDVSSNLAMQSIGAIGLWLRAEPTSGSANLGVQILLDDEAGGTEISTLRAVPADGQWYEYRWLLERNLDWDNYAGGDGRVNGAYFSIDSIRFTGDSDASFFLDDVFYQAAVPEPGALPLLLCAAARALRRRSR